MKYAILLILLTVPASASTLTVREVKGGTFFGWLKKQDLKLATKLGVPFIYRFDTGERLIGPKTTVWEPVKWFDVGLYSLTRLNKTEQDTADVAPNQFAYHALAGLDLDEIIKRYVYQPPEDWFINQASLGLVGGYDITRSLWWGGVQMNIDLDF